MTMTQDISDLSRDAVQIGMYDRSLWATHMAVKLHWIEIELKQFSFRVYKDTEITCNNNLFMIKMIHSHGTLSINFGKWSRGYLAEKVPNVLSCCHNKRISKKSVSYQKKDGCALHDDDSGH